VSPRTLLLIVLAMLIGLPVLAPSISGSATTLAVRTTYMHAETFEPSLGVDAAGRIFYSMTPVPGVAIGFGTGVWRSDDQGQTWSDVSPQIAGQRLPPETNDPYVYVDPGTGRVFQFAMSPILVCSIMSWSDDQGASWTTNPRGCGQTPPYDHQTMVASKPRTVPTIGYPNVLSQCVNQIPWAACSRSLDGGLTWVPGTVVYTNTYPATANSCPGSSVTGHLKAAPDGTIYLPSALCGHEAIVGVSKDDGLTWKVTKVTTIVPAAADPTIAVDEDGVAYYAFTDTTGKLQLSVSHDSGDSWSLPIVASPPGVTTNIPAMAAGAGGHIVLAYPGTVNLTSGFQTVGYSNVSSPIQKTITWHGYLTVSTDAADTAPTFDSVIVNDVNDPLVRGQCGPGRCPGMVDFIDVVIGGDGRPYAAFTDACQTTCVTKGRLLNTASEAMISTLTAGPLLR